MKITHLLASALLVAAIPAHAIGQPAQPTAGAARIDFERTPPYRDRVAARGPILTLTINDVVQRALQNNLDIAVERFNQDVVQQRIAGALGFYDPSVVFTTGVNSAINPLTAASGAATIPSETVGTATGGPSLRQNFIGGATASVGVTGVRTLTTNTLAAMSPSFGSTLTASVTQPLLRGFIHTATDRQTGVLRLDAAIARSQYRQKVTLVIQQVLNQYWELVFAIESYEARRQSKDLAILQYESTQVRVQNGLLAPVALTASRAEVASRERDLLQAEVQIINAENNLKQLLAEDPSSELWAAAIIPTDRPVAEEFPLPIAKAQEMARERRPELEQLRLQVSQNRIDNTFFHWERLPTFNLTANFASVGRAGTVLQRTADGRVPDPSNPAFGGFERAWRQAFDFNFPAWGVNLNMQVPIRNRATGSQLAQARIVGTRLSTQMTKTIQSVSVDVRIAFQVIATQRKGLEAARITTQLFEEQLAAQTARYEAGFSSDFELLRYQRDLVDARVRELRALVDLQQGVIALQRFTDTLLETAGVQVPE